MPNSLNISKPVLHQVLYALAMRYIRERRKQAVAIPQTPVSAPNLRICG